MQVTLAAACEPGDLLAYSTGWKLALATVGTAIPARLVAGQKGAIGDKIGAFAIAKVNGFTGATVGAAVYLAEGTASGDYTATAPSTSGDLAQPVGYAVSATEVLINLAVPLEVTK
jgi:hypothetical protein